MENKMTAEELLKLMLERAITPEYIAELKKRIQEENERYEAWEREQRRLWHKHKHDTYDL